MYCTNCGKELKENSDFCPYCGYNRGIPRPIVEDKASFAFAFIGFIFPIVGLILFLVYNTQSPLKAKSAGKGAIAGFITSIILSILLTILFFVGFIKAFDSNSDWEYFIEDTFGISSIVTTEDMLAESLDVSFGEFTVSTTDYGLTTTSLPVTVTNKADYMYSYYIEIEAIDNSGSRIDTDLIIVDSLNPGQNTIVEAFQYVQSDEIEKYKSATFKVLEVDRYTY